MEFGFAININGNAFILMKISPSINFNNLIHYIMKVVSHHNLGDQLWPLILEKALAILYEGY